MFFLMLDGADVGGKNVQDENPKIQNHTGRITTRERQKRVLKQRNETRHLLASQLSELQHTQSMLDIMQLLEEPRDIQGNTIGHLCVNHYTLKQQYVQLLQSLKPEALLTTLQLSNARNQSIFSLYRAYDLNISALCVKYLKKNPAIFFRILTEFELTSRTLQGIVNTGRCKLMARAYLNALPYNDENQTLLETCLDTSTTLGQFCSMKANHIFKGEGNKTIDVIQTKLEEFEKQAVHGRETPIDLDAWMIEPPVSPAFNRSCLFSTKKNGHNTLCDDVSVPEKYSLSHMAESNIKFGAYAGALMILFYALCAYFSYEESSQEDDTAFRP